MEYIIRTPDSGQANSLIQYLQSLDYVEVISVESRKAAGVAAMNALVKNLPNQKHTQAEVNKAVRQTD